MSGQSSDNLILDYSTACVIEDGKNIVEKSYLIQVNNQAGNWITDIEISFQKGNKIKSLEGEIRDSAGNTIRKLKKSDIVETSHISNISLYDDNYVKKFSLKHNQYPYQIFYKYVIEYSEFMWIASWTPVLHTETPTINAQLSLNVSNDFKVKISQEGISKTKTDTIGSRISHNWQYSYMDILTEEVYAPNLRDLLPSVHVVPVNFYYGGSGKHETWATYGQWLENLSAGLNFLPISEKGKIHHLIKGTEDKKEIIKLLYNYMQDNTRYINVAIDIGGMKPYPAEYVALNKYGDCKALTNYMKAMLEVAQIPSYCVDVFADENPRQIDENFPSQQFNHVVLMVPLEKDTVWLENTSNTYPVGYVSSFIQNRKGLLVNDEKSYLIDIPELGVEEVKENRSIIYNIDEQLNCIANINATYKGPKFEFYNAVTSQYTQHQQKQILQKYLPFKNYDLTSWGFQKPDRNTPEITLDLALILKNFIAVYGNDYILKPQPLSLADFQSPEQRKLPVEINFPTYKVDSITFKFPGNMVVKKHSEPVQNISRFGSYSIEIENYGHEVKIIRKFILNRGSYSLSEYPAFYDFIQKVKYAESKNFINLMLANN